MPSHSWIIRPIFLITLLYSSGLSQQWIASVFPELHSNNLTSGQSIVITSAVDLAQASITSDNIRLVGSHSGLIPLSQTTYDAATKKITIVPAGVYASGERLTLSLFSEITNTAGTPQTAMILQFNAAVKNSGINVFDTTTVISIPNAIGCSTVDMNSDGFTDIVINDLQGLVRVYINNGNKTFTSLAQMQASMIGYYGGKNVAADFDRDGDMDIALPNKWGLLNIFTNNSGLYAKKEFPVFLGQMNPDNMITAEPADLNGDGCVDFFIPNGNLMVNSDLAWASASVIATNNKNNTFSLKATTDGGGGYGSVASGDIDNDGDIDIAVTNVHNGQPYWISILKNDGKGDFTKTGSISIKTGSRAFSFTDIDNDHDLDFLYASSLDGSETTSALFIHLNNGTGDFSSSLTPVPVQFQPTDLKACDMNGDGMMDLVMTNIFQDAITILIRNPNGTFASKLIATRNAPYLVHATDFDRDGDVDLAVLCSNALQIIWNESIVITPRQHDFGILSWKSADTVVFRLRNIDPLKPAQLISSSIMKPGFSLIGVPNLIPANDSASFSVAFSPVTSSSYIDTLKLTYANSETLSFAIPLTGTSQPVFSLSPLPYSNTADTNVSVVAGISFTLDPGLLSSNAIAVHGSLSGYHPGKFTSYQSGSKELTFDPSKPFIPGEWVRVSLTSQTKDPGGDSLAVPVVWEYGVKTVSGSGTFSLPAPLISEGWTYYTLAADFNADGSTDLVNISGSSCMTFLNDGFGTFTLTSTTVLDGGSGTGAVGDIDHDGAIDILVSLGYSQSMQWLKNNGKGVFTKKPAVITSPYSIRHTELADMNNDGYPDMVSVNDYSKIHITFNNQQGSFDLQYHFESGRYTNKHCLGDFDADGDLDVVASAEGELYFHRNNGKGVLSLVKIDTLKTFVSSLVAADFTNDGLPDIAVGQGNSMHQPFFLLTGNGNFSFTKTYFGSTGRGTGRLVSGDIDSDGDLDIIIKNFALPSFDVYTNTNNGDFSGLIKTYSAGTGSDILLAEMNGDGTPDIALRLKDASKPNTILPNRRTTASISVSPVSVNFGKTLINKVLYKSIRIFNNGTATPMTVLISSPGEHAFDVSPDSVVIDPQDSIEVMVSFLPSQGRPYSDALKVLSNDPFRPVISIPLSGEGITKPLAPLLKSPADSAQFVPTTVVLSWQHNPAVDKYHIQVYKNSLSGPLFADIATVTDSSMKLSLLEHSTTYVWRVSGINLAGEGAYSVLKTFTTFKKGPVNVAVNAVNYNSVKVSWDLLNDPSMKKYFVYIGVRPDSLTTKDSVNAGIQQLLVSNIITGKIYYYAVSAIDSGGHETDLSGPVRSAIPNFAVHQKLGDTEQTPIDAAWGDFDNDNDLDLVMTGYHSSRRRTILYQNQSDTLKELWSIDRGTFNSFVEWNDFDGDGDIDLLHGNYYENTPPFGSVTEIYRNDGPGPSSSWQLTKLDTALSGEYPAWIDYDNDGDLDIMVGARSALLYRNDGPATGNKWKFTMTDMGYLYLVHTAFGDFDNDGMIDIGDVGVATDLRIMQNKGKGMFEPVFSDPGFGYSQGAEAVWADMNNDGRLDFCVNGGNNSTAKTRVYFNEGPSGSSWNFVRSLIPNSVYENARIAVGDFNNDGWNDIFYSGRQRMALVFNNSKSAFDEYISGIDSTKELSAYVAGDFTNDGQLDMAVMTYLSPATIYKNVLPAADVAPTSPTGLATSLHGDTVVLRWDPVGDTTRAVTYNFYVRSMDGVFAIPPSSDPTTGYRRIAVKGNAGTATKFMVRLPANKKYIWSVQIVSATFRGSPFSVPDTFITAPLSAEQEITSLPERFALEQNFPNPFNPATTIQYDLPQRGNVVLEVFNTLGQVVHAVNKNSLPAGTHREQWNAGRHATGVYFYRIIVYAEFTGDELFRETKKLLLLR